MEDISDMKKMADIKALEKDIKTSKKEFDKVQEEIQEISKNLETFKETEELFEKEREELERKRVGLVEKIRRLKNEIKDKEEAERKEKTRQQIEEREQKKIEEEERKKKEKKDKEERKQKEKEEKRQKKEDEKRKRDEERKIELERKKTDEIKRKQREKEQEQWEKEQKQWEKEQKHREKEQKHRLHLEQQQMQRLQFEKEVRESLQRFSIIEKQREEEERKRIQKRDPNFWPMFRYDVIEEDEFGQTVVCVLLTMPNGVEESDIICKRSFKDVDKYLDSKDEHIESSLIRIKASKIPTHFEMPIRVYLPIKRLKNQRTFAVKYSVGGGKFKNGAALPTLNVPDVDLVGVEIDIRQLTTIESFVISSSLVETIVLDKDVCSCESSQDRNIQLSFKKKTFDRQTTLETKVISRQILHNDNGDNTVKTTGPFVELNFENKPKNDITVTFFQSGVSETTSRNGNKSPHQKIIENSTPYLVNNMDRAVVESFIEENSSDFVEADREASNSQKSVGDKIRYLLKRLYSLDFSIFNKFVTHLSTKQPEVGNEMKNYMNTSTDNIGVCSDFEEINESVHFVLKVPDKRWNVLKLTESSLSYPTERRLILPTGFDNYRCFGIVAPGNMTEDDICTAADEMEFSLCATNVSIICRQRRTHMNEIKIECVQSEMVIKRIEQLDSLGFTEGPPENTPISVTDGEEITFTFEPNLYLKEYKNSPFSVKYFNNLPSVISGNLEVCDRSKQMERENYHGYLKYDVSHSKMFLRSRTGRMEVFFPKQKPLPNLLPGS